MARTATKIAPAAEVVTDADLPGLPAATAAANQLAVMHSKQEAAAQAIAAAHGAGLDLLGYTSQGQFLLNCGILDLLAAIPGGTPEYIRASGAVNTLLMPHEMGELFKVIAIGRGIDEPLTGFASGDQSRRL